MNQSLVSVCVPCYNVAPYIAKLLESLLAQTYKNLEIILVDDGSTDNTHTIISEYIPKLENEGYRVIYIRQENGGQSAAINTGLKHVTGEFFTWPDPDDWLTPDSIEKRVLFLHEHPSAHFVRGNMCSISETAQEKIKCYEPINNQPHIIPHFYEKLLITNTWFGAMVSMIRFSTFLEANNGRDIYVSKPAGQNWQMMLPIAAKYECWQLPEVLGYYLIRESSHYHIAEKTSKSQYLFKVMCEDVLIQTLKRISPSPSRKDYNKVLLHFSRLRFKIAIKGGLLREALQEYIKLFKCRISLKEALKKALLLMTYAPFARIFKRNI